MPAKQTIPKTTPAPTPDADVQQLFQQLLTAPEMAGYRAEIMEELPIDGPMRRLSDGRIVLEANADTVITLRCPTLGEFRSFQEYATAMAKGEVKVEEDTTIAWWRKIVEVLGDRALPAEDECPVWLARATYQHQVSNTWARRPTPAPGT